MKSYFLPHILKIDIHCLEKMEFYLKKNNINFKKGILLTDNILFEKYRHILENINNVFKDKSLTYRILENNSIRSAIELSERVIEDEIDLIIGFGGGKVLDVAKYASFISKRLMISIPTAIAHDGIASPIAVLKSKDGFTRSLGAKVPTAIFIDISVIKDSPIDLIKAGIGDTLSNYTAIYDWKLASRAGKEDLNDFAVLISELSFNSLFRIEGRNIQDIDFLYQLAESIVLSGMAMEIAGTSRPCSGSEHLFSHSVDKYFKINNLHGIQVALGAVVSAYFQKRDFNSLLKFLNDLNIEIKPSKLGLDKKMFFQAWEKARGTRPERYTILDEIDISENELDKIYNIIEKF